MIVKINSASLLGIDATKITIEVSICPGVNFFLVGLPDSAVKESQQRVKSALTNNGLKYPGREITINMAPADLRKEGSMFDLPIAIGILAASGQLESTLFDDTLIVGELSLDGELKPIKGGLSIASLAKELGMKKVIVPDACKDEASSIEGIDVYAFNTLLDVIQFLENPEKKQPDKGRKEIEDEGVYREIEDFSDVKGQLNVKRAFEIAAAGGHNVILVGPPGAGKSMLAKRFPSILPTMSLDESIETTKIYSSIGGGQAGKGLIRKRPFRKPHHTISDVALVGGGIYPQPGEISLAHNGVLFLDEFPEYKRGVLEVMRQPMEDRTVTISRAKFTVDYPTSFILIAAMNPCPCGYYNHPERSCSCNSNTVERYLSKISGPLMDRIDLHIEVTPVSYDELREQKRGETSQSIRSRVVKARTIQKKRFKESKAHCNSEMLSREVRSHCVLIPSSEAILKRAMKKMGFSARAYDRILKVSRTIADLAGEEYIQPNHIAEAVQYRSLDRKEWGS